MTGLSGDRYGTMMIAMILARAVQMAGYQIVGMVAVRHSFMATLRSVLVRLFVAIAGVVRSTDGLIGVGIFEHTFVNVITVHMVQMTVVQVIGMILMLDCSMATGGPVFVLVPGVSCAVHGNNPFGD